MNAYKTHKENKSLEVARKLIDENMERYVEHVELLFLYIMYNEYGHTIEDLYHTVEVFSEYYEYFRNRFVLNGDDPRFYAKEKRMDTEAIRYMLKEAGFDYDEACERAKKALEERHSVQGE